MEEYMEGCGSSSVLNMEACSRVIHLSEVLAEVCSTWLSLLGAVA